MERHMADLVDTIVGIRHFIGDRTPKNIPLAQPRSRATNPWLSNNKPIVAKLKAGEDLKVSIGDAIALLGNLRQVITRGDKVLVKPNFNSPDPFPAATALLFLRGMLETLVELGARVTIGESSGGIWRPTRNVFRKLGLYELASKLNVELIAFDDKGTDWVKIEIGGSYLRSVTMPRVAYEADRIVYLPCMKTHRLAGYSGALKLAFGFVHPGERRGFHLRHLQQKVAEVSLCWQPDLIVMDGRKTFVAGGPDKGQLAEPGLLLASGDLVAIDVEAVKIILAYGAKNRLPPNPWQLPQIATALRHSLGASGSEYTLVERL
jgi:uncharacterized protein (DUF362 family)